MGDVSHQMTDCKLGVWVRDWHKKNAIRPVYVLKNKRYVQNGKCQSINGIWFCVLVGPQNTVCWTVKSISVEWEYKVKENTKKSNKE